MAEGSLISIIMPARNAAPYIRSAVDSVRAQTWTDWELIIVDNSSTDGTMQRVADIDDPRIVRLEEPRPGVSRARNRGLFHMRGDLCCFLDADDIMPPEGLRSRATRLMERPDVAFVDGRVLAMDHRTGALSPRHVPTFTGPPFTRLMALDPGVFFGPSWMIRRAAIGDGRFPEDMTHAEDLAFYLRIARQGRYDHVDDVVLHYRTGHGSAMADVDGLRRGYAQLHALAMDLVPPPHPQDLQTMRRRVRSILWRTYLKRGRPVDALRAFLRPI